MTIHITTTSRRADQSVAAALADHFGASVTVLKPASLRVESTNARQRVTSWVGHHRSKGGMVEVVRQLMGSFPKLVRRGRSLTRRQPDQLGAVSLTSQPQDDSATWQVLVGPVDGPTGTAAGVTAEVIRLAIGPSWWWGEPWKPALAHRDLSQLAVHLERVGPDGATSGHLVRRPIVGAEDTARVLDQRLARLATELCVDAMAGAQLISGPAIGHSTGAERTVVDCSDAVGAAAWSDMVAAATRF